MQKLLIQGFVLFGLFASLSLGLGRLPWLQWIGYERKTDKLEARLGKEVIRVFSDQFTTITDSAKKGPLDSMVAALCVANNIDADLIEVHLMESEQINAFAAPGKHLVVFTGLIQDAENSGQIMGVLAHELGHITKRHVIKSLLQQMSIAVLMGGSGPVAGEVAGRLTQLSFSREMETEADDMAVDYLIEANINPKHLSDFFYRIEAQEGEDSESMAFLSTHPNAEERAQRVAKQAKKRFKGKDLLMADTQFVAWKKTLKTDKKPGQ